MEYEIRRVRSENWADLRDVRLAALADAPCAFASTLDQETGYDERRWREWIGRTVFFLAWHGGRPAGLVGGFGQEDGGWHVISMWVSPPARGAGLAGRLIAAVARHARAEGAPALTLWVTDGNDRARAFYRRAGFRSTGRRQPVRPQTPELWEEEMLLALAAAQPVGGRMGGVGSLMLLDAASLYYRAFYGVPETITAPDGTPVNAVRGLLDMISRLVRGRSPGRLIACWDADWRPAFRVEAMPSYKAHRAEADGTTEQTPPALAVQVPVIEEVLTAAGIVIAGAPGYEADDVIGTLAARADCPVDVVTGDRDLFQVVDDQRQVRVIYTVRGLTKFDVVDESVITERYQIPGRAYADFAVLRGDPSDGLPGVPGVGDKTAASLIRSFGSLDGILTALDRYAASIPAGPRAKLSASREYLTAAVPVVRVATDAPLPPLNGSLPFTPPDGAALEKLGERWGLGSSLRRMRDALAGE
jgi:5'-3' exonuclease/ribosomal protein S18 acetylase RimI-like enzyme